MQKKVVVTDRTIWGWDDAYIFVRNKNKGIDVISPLQRRTIFTLQNPYFSAVQYLECYQPQELKVKAKFMYLGKSLLLLSRTNLHVNDVNYETRIKMCPIV